MEPGLQRLGGESKVKPERGSKPCCRLLRVLSVQPDTWDFKEIQEAFGRLDVGSDEA